MSLKIWLPLDGDLKDRINQVTAAASAAVIYGDGKVTTKSFSGGSSYIKFPWEDSKTNAFSAAMWVKPNTPAAWQDIFSFGDGDNRIEVDNTLTQYRWYSNANTLVTSGTILFSLPDNEWNHIAMTANGTKVCFYLNGVLAKELTQANTLATTFGNLNELRLCCRTTTGTNLWKGFVNDARFYDHCLTPREVKQLAQGLILHYKLNNDNNTNILPQSYTLKGSATKRDEEYGFIYHTIDNSSGTSYKDFSWGNIITASLNDVYTVSFYARSKASNSITTFLYNNVAGVQVGKIEASTNRGNSGNSTDGNCLFNLTPQWQKCYVTYTFNGSRENSTANLTKSLLFRVAVGGVVDVAFPKLERGSVATPYGLKPNEVVAPLVETDCSGWGNHGTRSTELSYISNKESRYSNSTSFDNGVKIRCNSFTTEGWSDITMAAWVRPRNTANGTDINTIIIGGVYLAIRTSNNCVTTYCYGKNPAGYHTGKTPLPLNAWSHIAAVWDGKTGVHKIYVNGKEDFSIACTGVSTTGAQDKKDFGRENEGTRTYVGEMADARIYATPLSAADIKTLYESSAAMLENGSMQAYEFIEEPDVFNIKMHQTGSVKASDISEIGYVGGMKTKVLPDGSAWARIHWLDVSTDTTYFANANEVAFCDKPNRFSRMGLVDHFKSYDLPKGYEALDYIQSTGTQYIDTGYYWQSEVVKVVMDAAVTSNSSNQSLFGNEEPFSGGRYFSIVPHGNNGNFAFYVGSSTGLLSGSLALNTRFTMECSTSSDKKFTLKLQGTTVNTLAYGGTVMAYANTTSTNASKGKIYIFANHNSSTNGTSPIQNIGGMKLYGFKMYDNNLLVRDFMPCKNSAGTVGLYDKVFGVFYSSPNSVAFTAGPGATNTASKADGIYEFMLTYPRLSATDYNRWTQASSPNSSTVAGLRKITTAWNGHHGGIRKHGSACLYNCDTGSTWYAPIGQYSRWTDTQAIPAANGTSQTETELWVRIDNLPQLNKISMLDEEYLQALNINEI